MRRDTNPSNQPELPAAVEATADPALTPRTVSSAVVGVALSVYAGVLLLASYALWSYAENLFLWAWLYYFVRVVRYTSYALALKGLSVVTGLLGLVVLLTALVLIVDGVARRRGSL